MFAKIWYRLQRNLLSSSQIHIYSFSHGISRKIGFKVDQMDAVTAFLQGDLSEEIYMTQPEGFNSTPI